MGIKKKSVHALNVREETKEHSASILVVIPLVRLRNSCRVSHATLNHKNMNVNVDLRY